MTQGMQNPSFALAEPLIQKADTNADRYGRQTKLLIALVSLGLVATSLVACIRSGDGLHLAAAITMPWNSMQSLRAPQAPGTRQFLQPARVWQPMQAKRPLQVGAWQQATVQQTMQPLRATAGVAVAPEDPVFGYDELIREAAGPDCTDASRGEDGQVTKVEASELLNIWRCNPDRLVVVKFFATWCKSCKMMEPKYKKLAKKDPETRFFEIDATNHIGFLKDLNIKSLPFVQMYRGNDALVDEFVCGYKNMTMLEERVMDHGAIPRAMQRVSAGLSMESEFGVPAAPILEPAN